MNPTITAIFSMTGTICAMVFGYIAMRRTQKEDHRLDGRQGGIILTEIGYIKSGVDDIKRKQEKTEAQYVDVIERLAMMEASIDQAHKRLDQKMEAVRNE